MDRVIQIKEQSIKRLQKDIAMYEEELLSIREEKSAAEKKEDSFYALKTINERFEETEKALTSTKAVLKKFEEELKNERAKLNP